LGAVNKYGRIIHEFDPWFNFRATQYLVDNGWEKFSNWFDDMSWYPIGRHVGSTLYPGMMVTSAVIFRVLEFFDMGISLNDVCVFVPAGFSIITCIFTFLSTHEISGNVNAGIVAAGVMAIIPAHLMRSVAGGYDNESVAVAAISATFYFWVLSLRSKNSWPWGIVCGISYIYMVASWGAYPFVLNMIGVHAGLMVLLGRFDSNLHRAYSLFYVIGTAGAIQFPIVGLQPLKSMEQMGPLAVFFGLQVFELAEYLRKAWKISDKDFFRFRLKVMAGAVLVAAVVIGVVLPDGYFGPLGSRIKSLFIPHTKTGNPLVDSVAEHQATPGDSYYRFFHVCMFIGPIGFFTLFYKPTNGKIFLIAYTAIATYFSRKMVRLILLLAPAASMTTGIAVALSIEWAIRTLMSKSGDEEEETTQPESKQDPKKDTKTTEKDTKKGGKKASKKGGKKTKSTRNEVDIYAGLKEVQDKFKKMKNLHKVIAVVTLLFFANSILNSGFYDHCTMMAQALSEPQIILQGRGRDGKDIMIDDFRESYWWLRDHTPADARVMAWWDYGYQINGIGNRTTIADGNTWNHEHIALLGKCLVSPEEEAYQMIRHLADYVLIWSTRWGGMWGDDLAKMPHMARIGASVYADVKNPYGFYLDQEGHPSPQMRDSLLYKLHSYRFDPSVKEPVHFREVYTSKYNMVRIYSVKNISQSSKRYVKEHHDYPPALEPVLKTKKAFDRNKEKRII
jgi:dolichyl-diphosphooligosaccharide--protein glycosyltransferase